MFNLNKLMHVPRAHTMKVLSLMLAATVAPAITNNIQAVPSFPSPAEIVRLGEDINRRFIARPQGLLLDYARLDGSIELPNAEDCRLGRPNALSWWTPLENGPFLTGLYLDAVLRRHEISRTSSDASLARELANGLLRCEDPDGTLPGFIARGVYGPDLSSPAFYGIGSDDQTAPWFFGLWRYLQSGIPGQDEAQRIKTAMLKTAEALERNRWLMPCAPVGDLAPGHYRGGWAGPDFRGATRLLFVARILQEITGDTKWKTLYEAKHAERFTHGLFSGQTRLQLVTAGMEGEWKEHPVLRHHLWIYVVSQAMLAELVNLESNAEIKLAYNASLQANATACASIVTTSVPDETLSTPFRTDWRAMQSQWKPQRSPDEAVAIAQTQMEAWKNRGRELEIKWVREPACAAWIAFFAPQFSSEIESAAARFQNFVRQSPWTRLSASHGLFAEGAWQLLNATRPDIAPNAHSSSPQATAPFALVATTDRLFEDGATRCTGGFPFSTIPNELRSARIYTVARGSIQKPGGGFKVSVPAGSTLYLLVMDKGKPSLSGDWEPAAHIVEWNAGTSSFRDKVYRQNISSAREIVIPESSERDNYGYAIPHALIVTLPR